MNRRDSIQRGGLLIWAWSIPLLFIILLPAMAAADDTQTGSRGNHHHPPVGIHIEMTEAFYQALKDDSQGGTRDLSTGMSETYLHQIAIATRYTVETNLQILKQQERIIQLLEALQGKPGDGKP